MGGASILNWGELDSLTNEFSILLPKLSGEVMASLKKQKLSGK